MSSSQPRNSAASAAAYIPRNEISSTDFNISSSEAFSGAFEEALIKVSRGAKSGVEVSKFSEPDPRVSVLPKRKTALPDFAKLPGLGNMPVEVFQEVCSCCRPLGRLGYAAGVAVAAAVARTRSADSGAVDAFVTFCDSNELKMCCRSSVLEPTVCFVVSADIDAYVDTISGVSAWAPPPSTIFEGEIIPPPLIAISEGRV